MDETCGVKEGDERSHYQLGWVTRTVFIYFVWVLCPLIELSVTSET